MGDMDFNQVARRMSADFETYPSWNPTEERVISGDLGGTPPRNSINDVLLFDDDFSTIMNMDALRGLVASVVPEAEHEEFDLQASYAKVNLDEVVSSTDVKVLDISPPPTKRARKTAHQTARKCPTKWMKYAKQQHENKENLVEKSEESEDERPWKKARASPECIPAAQKFLELFVRGTLAKKPVTWTQVNMEKLAKKLKICSRFVQMGREYTFVDEHGVFHPTEELIKKWGPTH